MCKYVTYFPSPVKTIFVTFAKHCAELDKLRLDILILSDILIIKISLEANTRELIYSQEYARRNAS